MNLEKALNILHLNDAYLEFIQGRMSTKRFMGIAKKKRRGAEFRSHPDRGGTEEVFCEVRAAWDLVVKIIGSGGSIRVYRAPQHNESEVFNLGKVPKWL